VFDVATEWVRARMKTLAGTGWRGVSSGPYVVLRCLALVRLMVVRVFPETVRNTFIPGQIDMCPRNTALVAVW